MRYTFIELTRRSATRMPFVNWEWKSYYGMYFVWNIPAASSKISCFRTKVHNAPLLTGQIVSQQAPIFIRMHLDRVLFMQSTASYQDVC